MMILCTAWLNLGVPKWTCHLCPLCVCVLNQTPCVVSVNVSNAIVGVQRICPEVEVAKWLFVLLLSLGMVLNAKMMVQTIDRKRGSAVCSKDQYRYIDWPTFNRFSSRCISATFHGASTPTLTT